MLFSNNYTALYLDRIFIFEKVAFMYIYAVKNILGEKYTKVITFKKRHAQLISSCASDVQKFNQHNELLLALPKKLVVNDKVASVHIILLHSFHSELKTQLNTL